MAEKTVKKPAKNAEVVKTVDDLKKDLDAKRKDLLEAKLSLASGELANPRVLGAYRKDIARLLTEINVKEQQ